MTTDWITPLYQVTRDALTDGQVVALPVDYYPGVLYMAQRLAIETWAWSISGDQVVFSVHTDDMALLAEELGLAAQPRPRVVAVGAAVFMWLLLFAMLGGAAWGAMLMGGL